MASSSGEQGDMIRQLFSTDDAKDSLSRSLHTRKTLARLVEIAGQAEEKKAPAKRRRAAPRKAADEGEEEAPSSGE
jgi:hypothetical protein